MEQTLANQNQSRILKHETFDGKGFTNNNSLSQMRLTSSDTLNPVITHLMGEESKKFPLTFLTEGQKGGMRWEEIQDVEYKWPVFTRIKASDTIVSTEYTAASEAGKGGTPAFVIFKSNWLKQQHLIIAPDGTMCRIQGKPEPIGGGKYKYALSLIRRNNSEYIPFEMLQAGVRWSMTGGAPVSESHSSGNESNKQAPGYLKNQISILRKSYEIGGNVSNRTVEFQLKTKTGKTTNYWMPFEEYQHEMQFKEACEEHLWWSKYNRDEKGNITTIDEVTNFPIPMGGGIDDQIPHKDTYGILTTQKLTRTVSDVLYGGTDTGRMDVVLFTGIGGAEEFDAAIKRDANGSGSWTLLQGDVASKFVVGQPGSHELSFGGYFNRYVHVDGHIVTIKLLNLLDFGGRADNSPRHPISGKPLSSYEMYFVDMSQYDGVKNVQMISQKGRSLIRGIEQGMTLLKGDHYGDYSGNGKNLMLATDQDKTSIHFLKTLGVCIRRNTHCFKLSCNLS